MVDGATGQVARLVSPALLRYLRYLPPRMLIGKARHSLDARLRVPRAVTAAPPPHYDWCAAFAHPELADFAAVFRVYGERFADTCDQLHQGRFVSNRVSYPLDRGAIWDSDTIPAKHLRWRFDLAYFFAAIPLIDADEDRGLQTVASMLRDLDTRLLEDSAGIRKLQWSPIAVAVRIMSLTTALSLCSTAALTRQSRAVHTIGQHLWRCTEMLRFMVERHLGFNHAAFTESGLAVGLYLQGRRDEAARRLEDAVLVLEDSTLPDGMWAERSPTYHIHMLVLGDALQAMLDGKSELYRRLGRLTSRMREALAAVVHPDGEIAMFNDAAIADAPAPAAVGWKEPPSPSSIALLDAGYGRLSAAGTVVIMDAGAMGADAGIAHGHADFLSIEVSVAKHRFIVDPGVASLTNDGDRYWTRSAASHNGPTLRGCEPAEFIGAWKVGRRARAWFDPVDRDRSDVMGLRGVCDGYRAWGIGVSRSVLLDVNGLLRIEDRWSGAPTQARILHFLISGDWQTQNTCDERVEFVHNDGSTVILSVRSGRITDLRPSRHFLDGSMSAMPATSLSIEPHDDYVMTVLEAQMSEQRIS